MSNRVEALPKRWTQVRSAFEKDGWELNRISGSHHIFTKSGCRCIPVAVHGGTMSPQKASRVLEQAGIRQTRLEIHSNNMSLDDTLEKIAKETKTLESVSPTSSRRRKKLPDESKTPTKAQREEDALKTEEAKILLDQFKDLQLQKSVDEIALNKQRSELLGRIQDMVAMGDYDMAIQSTGFIEEVDDFGSSSDAWQFNTDILFYRTVALSEHALIACCTFNSPRQQEQIRAALSLLTQFMNNSPARRKESREFASNLQRRVVKDYTSGLNDVLAEYNYVDAVVRENEQAAALFKHALPFVLAM